MDMWISSSKLMALVAPICFGMELRLLPEYQRPDPFGGIVQVDRSTASTNFIAARRSYVSAQIVASLDQPADYSITVKSPLPVDVYREWFHKNKADGLYYPDALIPVKPPYRSRLPEPDNRVPKQTAQGFWLDIWIPVDTKPGSYTANVSLTSAGQSRSVPIEIRVVDKVTPEEDTVILDHNSYGTSWMFGQYPKTLPPGNDAALFRLIHAYHRQFYEHRGTFHQLGYGHGGKVGPEFAPELAGSGKNKRIASWDKFDQHYGPLLDGSAFRDTRRGAKPIPYAYLPINPEWPASMLWWGEPGYEAEFVGIVSAMEKHFREKQWTSTYFELFFNHKKRYKGFSWDGDEQRFSRDNDFLAAYRKLFDKAVPTGSPVRFLTRADTSWSMQEQFTRLNGIVNFWVAGEGMLSWYPGSAEKLKARGDHIWSYGGTPTVDRVSTQITLNPLRSWVTGVQGFVRWQTVDPGPDPWFALEGGGETLVYPGDRFGINGPLPSIRLKLQRNCLQDLALLKPGDPEVVRRYNVTKLADWQNTAPALASTPVLDWNNLSIEEALKPFEDRFARVQPDAWMRVREYALGVAQ